MTIDSPYAPPSAEVQDFHPDAGSQAEGIRREHLRHEVSLKSVGSLYLLSGSMFVLGSVGSIYLFFMESAKPGGGETIAPMLAVIAIYVVLAAAMLTLGIGFRRLRPWVRIPGGILSGIGLLGIPIGTLINGYILFLMFGQRGRVVLAPDYRAIIDATPHVRYRRTVSDWIALGLLGAIVIAGLVMILLALT